MQELCKWYLRPYCIKRLLPGFCTYDAFYTVFIFRKLKGLRLSKIVKMCTRTYILKFHQKLNFVKKNHLRHFYIQPTKYKSTVYKIKIFSIQCWLNRLSTLEVSVTYLTFCLGCPASIVIDA